MTRHAPLTGASLRRAIRSVPTDSVRTEEEIERQMGPPRYACHDCPEFFAYQVELLAHDLAAHYEERIARAEANLKAKRGSVPTDSVRTEKA